MGYTGQPRNALWGERVARTTRIFEKAFCFVFILCIGTSKELVICKLVKYLNQIPLIPTQIQIQYQSEGLLVILKKPISITKYNIIFAVSFFIKFLPPSNCLKYRKCPYKHQMQQTQTFTSTYDYNNYLITKLGQWEWVIMVAHTFWVIPMTYGTNLHN